MSGAASSSSSSSSSESIPPVPRLGRSGSSSSSSSTNDTDPTAATATATAASPALTAAAAPAGASSLPPDSQPLQLKREGSSSTSATRTPPIHGQVVNAWRHHQNGFRDGTNVKGLAYHHNKLYIAHLSTIDVYRVNLHSSTSSSSSSSSSSSPIELIFLETIEVDEPGNDTGSYSFESLAIHNNELYISDFDRHCIHVLSLASSSPYSYIRRIGVYYEDESESGRVGYLSCPDFFTIDSNESIIYISDWRNYRISIYNTTDGKYIDQIGPSDGSGDGEMKIGQGITFSSDNRNILLLDNFLERITFFDKRTGQYKKKFQLMYPGRDVLVLNDDFIYVTHDENNTIGIYSAIDGKLIQQIGPVVNTKKNDTTDSSSSAAAAASSSVSSHTLSHPYHMLRVDKYLFVAQFNYTSDDVNCLYAFE